MSTVEITEYQKTICKKVKIMDQFVMWYLRMFLKPQYHRVKHLTTVTEKQKHIARDSFDIICKDFVLRVGGVPALHYFSTLYSLPSFFCNTTVCSPTFNILFKNQQQLGKLKFKALELERVEWFLALSASLSEDRKKSHLQRLL